MQKFESILSRELFEFGEQTVTVSQLLVVPLILIVGIVVIRVVGRVLNRNLATRQVSPDIVQFAGRAFYIIALALLGFTILDALNVPAARRVRVRIRRGGARCRLRRMLWGRVMSQNDGLGAWDRPLSPIAAIR